MSLAKEAFLILRTYLGTSRRITFVEGETYDAAIAFHEIKACWHSHVGRIQGGVQCGVASHFLVINNFVPA
jgi:hypothetical protein